MSCEREDGLADIVCDDTDAGLGGRFAGGDHIARGIRCTRAVCAANQCHERITKEKKADAAVLAIAHLYEMNPTDNSYMPTRDSMSPQLLIRMAELRPSALALIPKSADGVVPSDALTRFAKRLESDQSFGRWFFQEHLPSSAVVRQLAIHFPQVLPKAPFVCKKNMAKPLTKLPAQPPPPPSPLASVANSRERKDPYLRSRLLERPRVMGGIVTAVETRNTNLWVNPSPQQTVIDPNGRPYFQPPEGGHAIPLVGPIPPQVLQQATDLRDEWMPPPNAGPYEKVLTPGVSISGHATWLPIARRQRHDPGGWGQPPQTWDEFWQPGKRCWEAIPIQFRSP